MRRSFLVGVLMALALLAGTSTVASSPAQAAVPDGKGWVLWNDASGTTVGFGTWPSGTVVSALGTGRYQITFPGQAAAGGVVHVTAVTGAPYYCQAESWSPSGVDELAIIRCSQPGGALVSTSFSAFFAGSSGPSSGGTYGYVSASSSGTVASQYNSAASTNTITPGATGQWTVAMPGLASSAPLAGSVQVTAVNALNPARCKAASWTSAISGQSIQIRCFDAGGNPYNTAFTVSYQFRSTLYGTAQASQRYGYVLFQPPLGPAVTNFGSTPPTSGVNSVSGGGGPFPVLFPRIGVAPDTVQVTAYGFTPDYCGMSSPWANLVAGPDLSVNVVQCFNNAGSPTATGFTVSATGL